MPTSRLLLPLAGIAASALMLAACGSSTEGSGSSGSGSGSGSGSAMNSPATVAQLQKIVLQAGDLPSTYKAVAPTPDTGSDSTTAQIEACTGVKGAPDSHKVHSAQSSDFQLGNTSLSSDFGSYQSQSDVDADAAQLKSPKIDACVNSAFTAGLTKSLGAKAKIIKADIRFTPGSKGGPANVVGTAAGVVTIAANGRQAAIYLGIAFITGPQLDGTLTYFSLGTPLDDATSARALAAVAKRAANP